MNDFFCPLPIEIDFIRWASVITEELSQYNIGIPTSEDTWLSWALQVYEVLDLEAEGMPNPNGFSEWRSWAERLSDIAQG
jgi:hypothetical protein